MKLHGWRIFRYKNKSANSDGRLYFQLLVKKEAEKMLRNRPWNIYDAGQFKIQSIFADLASSSEQDEANDIEEPKEKTTEKEKEEKNSESEEEMKLTTRDQILFPSTLVAAQQCRDTPKGEKLYCCSNCFKK